MRSIKTYLIILGSLLMIVSCKKESALPADMGYDYYPDMPGAWVMYRVDSVNWDDFSSSIDTFQYQILERIESIYTDEQGRPSLRIERYKRLSDTSQWVIKDVWFANRTASTLERVEENVKFLKLIFPPKPGEEWDGNIFNLMDVQNYEYIAIDEPYSLEGISFDSTLTVLQADEQTLISKYYGLEIYARGVGMIYKKYIDQKILLTGEIDSGKDFSYTLIDWGQE